MNEQTSHMDVPTALRGLPGRGRGGASGHRERGRIVQRVEGLHGVLKRSLGLDPSLQFRSQTKCDPSTSIRSSSLFGEIRLTFAISMNQFEKNNTLEHNLN